MPASASGPRSTFSISESLNDVVAGITGIRQRETLPDRIFDEADEVELIDLPAGRPAGAPAAPARSTASQQVGTATERFFRKPNLLALRELALRRTADRVDAAAPSYRAGAVSRPWLARDRFLIAVDPDGQAEQLVRVGKRFADALDAEWLVVSVETPALLKLSESERNRRIDVLRLAESLGAETVTLDGPSAADALLEYARLRNITRIVVGESRSAPAGGRWLRRSTATKLVRAGARLRRLGDRASGRVARQARARPRSWCPTEIRWDALLGRARDHRACTAVAARHVPVFRVDQHRHGVSAGRDRRRACGSDGVPRASPRSRISSRSTSSSSRRASPSR